MGSSSYRDDYGYREPKSRKRKDQRGKTPMEEVIERLQAVEASRQALVSAREGLEDAEHQFIEAEEELRRSEADVKAQIGKLDPESQAMLRTMLNRLDGKNRNNRDRDER